ncbi:MAG: hypothetical protein FWG50_07415 [Kiritimatiellaeota bacterium]|nr:hypothetical protein [Kiritimatiellota bacterium]
MTKNAKRTVLVWGAACALAALVALANQLLLREAIRDLGGEQQTVEQVVKFENHHHALEAVETGLGRDLAVFFPWLARGGILDSILAPGGGARQQEGAPPRGAGPPDRLSVTDLQIGAYSFYLRAEWPLSQRFPLGRLDVRFTEDLLDPNGWVTLDDDVRVEAALGVKDFEVPFNRFAQPGDPFGKPPPMGFFRVRPSDLGMVDVGAWLDGWFGEGCSPDVLAEDSSGDGFCNLVAMQMYGRSPLFSVTAAVSWDGRDTFWWTPVDGAADYTVTVQGGVLLTTNVTGTALRVENNSGGHCGVTVTANGPGIDPARFTASTSGERPPGTGVTAIKLCDAFSAEIPSWLPVVFSRTFNIERTWGWQQYYLARSPRVFGSPSGWSEEAWTRLGWSGGSADPASMAGSCSCVHLGLDPYGNGPATLTVDLAAAPPRVEFPHPLYLLVWSPPLAFSSNTVAWGSAPLTGGGNATVARTESPGPVSVPFAIDTSGRPCYDSPRPVELASLARPFAGPLGSFNFDPPPFGEYIPATGTALLPPGGYGIGGLTRIPEPVFPAPKGPPAPAPKGGGAADETVMLYVTRFEVPQPYVCFHSPGPHPIAATAEPENDGILEWQYGGLRLQGNTAFLPRSDGWKTNWPDSVTATFTPYGFDSGVSITRPVWYCTRAADTNAPGEAGEEYCGRCGVWWTPPFPNTPHCGIPPPEEYCETCDEWWQPLWHDQPHPPCHTNGAPGPFAAYAERGTVRIHEICGHPVKEHLVRFYPHGGPGGGGCCPCPAHAGHHTGPAKLVSVTSHIALTRTNGAPLAVNSTVERGEPVIVAGVGSSTPWGARAVFEWDEGGGKTATQTNAFTVMSTPVIANFDGDGWPHGSNDVMRSLFPDPGGWAIPAATGVTHVAGIVSAGSHPGDYVLTLEGDPGAVRVWESAAADGEPLLVPGQSVTNHWHYYVWVEAIAPGTATLTFSFIGTGAAEGFNCSNSLPITVLGVEVDVMSSKAGVSANPPPFEGGKAHAFDVTHSPNPDKHFVVFYKDVVNSHFNVQDFSVTLKANITPQLPPGTLNSLSPRWTKLSGPNSGALSSTTGVEVDYVNPKEGGVYRFKFELDGFQPTEFCVVLPLAGASVDDIMEADLVRAQAFATHLKANYSKVSRQLPWNGARWFSRGSTGDYSGRPDNEGNPTVWTYNQVNSTPILPDGKPNPQFGAAAVATWAGKPIKTAKLSNFMIGYTAELIGVCDFFQWVAGLSIGTPNDGSATLSWQAGRDVANGAPYAQTVSALVTQAWDQSDGKNEKLWPNLAPADNYRNPRNFSDVDWYFTSPMNLYPPYP